MRRPPDFSQAGRFPVTGGTVLLAILVLVAWWTLKLDVSPLMATAQVRRGEVWRLVTCTLVHLGVLHLAFDAYATWLFGTLVETTFGHLATLLIFVVLALGSSAAELAVFSGGAGLSGIGYGLFGMLWVLTHRDKRFAGAIDNQTAALFVGWFFFCILITFMGMPIGNVAHGTGFAMGALLGRALSSRGPARVAGMLATGVVLAVTLLAVMVYRPWINFSHDGSGEASNGFDALTKNDNQAALYWYRDAIRIEPTKANYWYNQAIAELREGQPKKAAADFHHAAALDPTDPIYQKGEEDNRVGTE